MSKVLKLVSLVTENCEVLTLNGSELIWVDYEQHDQILNTFERTSSELLGLCFRKDFKILLDDSFIISTNINNRTDITSVEFTFEDDEIETINISWPTGDHNNYITEHPGQRWFVTPEGNFMFQSWYSTDNERMSDEFVNQCIYNLNAMDKKA